MNEQELAPERNQDGLTEGDAVVAKEEEVKEARGSTRGTGSTGKTEPDEDASRDLDETVEGTEQKAAC